MKQILFLALMVMAIYLLAGCSTTASVEQKSHVIFTGAQTPGLLLDRLVMRQSLLKNRPEDVRAFTDAFLEAQEWTPDDLAFAQARIDQVGQVIENARLREETERCAQHKQPIREITTRIRAASDVQIIARAGTSRLSYNNGHQQIEPSIVIKSDNQQAYVAARQSEALCSS